MPGYPPPLRYRRLRRIARPQDFGTDAERRAYVESLRASATFLGGSTWPAVATAMTLVVAGFAVESLFGWIWVGSVALLLLAAGGWALRTRDARLVELAQAELELAAYLSDDDPPPRPPERQARPPAHGADGQLLALVLVSGAAVVVVATDGARWAGLAGVLVAVAVHRAGRER